MASSSGSLTTLALDMAWSLWDELGVTGTLRKHEDQALDLEPMILFAAWLADRYDRRLWEEVVDWCSAQHEFVNVARLRRLYGMTDREVQLAFGVLAAAVNANAPRAGWPYPSAPVQAGMSGKSRPPELERPALLQLRIRALFGVTSRAEVVRLLLVAGGRRWTASGLAWSAGFSKVNVASVLEAFRSISMVHVEESGMQRIYRLARAEELLGTDERPGLLQPVPAFQPDWTSRFAVAVALVKHEHADATDDFTLFREIDEPLRALGLITVAPRPSAQEPQLLQWGEHVMRYWSGEDEEQLQLDTLCYSVVKGSTGVFEVTVHEPGNPPYILQPFTPLYQGEVLDWRNDTHAARRHLAAQLRWHASIAAGNPSHDRLGLDPEANEFAREKLQTLAPGHARVFTGDYIRAWFAERQARSSIGLTLVPDTSTTPEPFESELMIELQPWDRHSPTDWISRLQTSLSTIQQSIWERKPEVIADGDRKAHIKLDSYAHGVQDANRHAMTLLRRHTPRAGLIEGHYTVTAKSRRRPTSSM
jgi:hypothetical protein